MICAARLFFTILLFSFAAKSQSEKIKIKKNSDQIYFFQRGETSDSISRSKGDLFYLFMSDSMKQITAIFIENGSLRKTNNDSLFTLIHVPGIKYECRYQKQGEHLSENNAFEFRCLINGTSTEDKSLIRIVFHVKEKTELENKFIYVK